MNNQSEGLVKNETYFRSKESIMNDSYPILNDGHTKISDVSREFRELNGEIFKTIQNTGDVSGLSNNRDNNNTNNSIGMNLLDDTWANRKSSPDTSENFQLKISEIKKKAKTPTANKVQHIKHTITLINNPQRGNSQFKILNKINSLPSNENLIEGSKNNENISDIDKESTINSSSVYNQQMPRQGTVEQKEDEDCTLTDDVPNTNEKINRLHINSVKTNDLREMDGKRSIPIGSLNALPHPQMTGNLINFTNYSNYTLGGANFSNIHNLTQNLISINPNTSQMPEYFECNEEFTYSENTNNRDLSKKTLNPKFMEKNNTLTRQSTNESGDSDNSCNPQFYNGNNTPNCMRNYQQSQLNMMHYPHVKKINFNNFGGYNGSNYNYNPTQYYTKNNFSQNHEPNLGNTINNNFQINICQTQQKINFQNLPENAFSFNIDNHMANLNLQNPIQNQNKSYSEKKKIKKSKDEVDQTLFLINTQNILEGKDRRTTIMIRHIPNKYSTQSLLEEINLNFRGKYDFFYLPMDFQNECNLGYAFINFVDSFYILQFHEVFRSRKWKKYKSHKECDLSYAKFQGQLELKSHLEKSCVMNKMGEDKKPVIITPPEPLPKYEIPLQYVESFKSLYPNLLYKTIFLK